VMVAARRGWECDGVQRCAGRGTCGRRGRSGVGEAQREGDGGRVKEETPAFSE